jgi:hypothetical protein
MTLIDYTHYIKTLFLIQHCCIWFSLQAWVVTRWTFSRAPNVFANIKTEYSVIARRLVVVLCYAVVRVCEVQLVELWRTCLQCKQMCLFISTEWISISTPIKSSLGHEGTGHANGAALRQRVIMEEHKSIVEVAGIINLAQCHKLFNDDQKQEAHIHLTVLNVCEVFCSSMSFIFLSKHLTTRDESATRRGFH